MSAVLAERASWPFGVAPLAVSKLKHLFDATPGLHAVWIYGSRARGDARHESDIDLAVDMPSGSFASLRSAIEELELLYRVDVVHLQSSLAPEFRQRIERDRRPFWTPTPATA